MAILKDPTFGKLSGRIGDLVFKQRYGKTIICYMPKKNKKNKKNNNSSDLQDISLHDYLMKHQRKQKP